MRRNAPFWRNLILVGILHVAVLLGLTRWSGKAQKLNASEIVWIDPGAAGALAALVPAAPEPPLPADESDAQAPAPEQPTDTPAASDIVLPVSTPSPTPTPSP